MWTSQYVLISACYLFNADVCCTKNVIGSTMAKLLQNFRNHVTDTVLRLEDSGFFQNRGELPKNQLEFLEAVLKGTVPDSQLHAVLFKLTEIFHVLHQKQVVVLIDEYDTPTSYASTRWIFSGGMSQPRSECANSFPSQANEFFRLVFSKLLKVSVICIDSMCC
jgi:hypothetical protein